MENRIWRHTKIDVSTVIPEASLSYNKVQKFQINNQNIDLLKLDGYLVNDFDEIKFPVLGKLKLVASLNKN